VHATLIERAGHLIYEEYFDGLDERWGAPLGRVSMTARTKLFEPLGITDVEWLGDLAGMPSATRRITPW
jgi:hypothetical protein